MNKGAEWLYWTTVGGSTLAGAWLSRDGDWWWVPIGFLAGLGALALIVLLTAVVSVLLERRTS